MSILHVELYENCGDDSVLAKTDAGTIFLVVDFDGKEFGCWAKIGGLVLFREPGLNLDQSIGSVLLVQH